MIKNTFIISAFICVATLLTAQTPCVDGMAGIYPCDHVDLLATMSREDLGAEVNFNDIWGWREEASGREFALVGMRNATAFVEVTDPINPVHIGTLATHDVGSLWRDIKVFNGFAFIVSESGNHGMQVFDLSRLLAPEEEMPVTFTHDAHYDLFGNAHNIVINEETGFAYAVGTETFAGGLHFIDINDPLNPTIVGGYDGDGYTHDAQVVIYDGPDEDYIGREIAFCSNEDAITIVDVTDKTDPEVISVTGYELSSYTHQGWLSHDNYYFIFNDEIDETDGFTETTKTLFLDIEDLDAPFVHYNFFSESTAIDHNLYTNGSLCYQSNYRAGLRILDVGNIHDTDISEVGYFDTQPDDDIANYSGSWSNYAYFPSGTIIVTDMYSNFFVLRANLVNTFRYKEVCGNVESVEFFIDVTYDAPITAIYSSDFLPQYMTVDIGTYDGIGRIPVTVNLNTEVEPGEYLIPITVASGEETLHSHNFKIVVKELDAEVDAALYTPANASEVDSPEVSLSWITSDGFEEYNLIIATGAEFNDIIVDEVVEGNSYEFDGVGTFYWKIAVATEPCQILSETEAFMFTNNHVGITELENPIEIYPNPASDLITVSGLTGNIEIISIDGRVLREVSVKGKTNIEISDLASGTYFLREKGKLAYSKFVKE